MIQRVAQKHTPKFLHHINYNHAPPQKIKMKKQLFGKIGAISSKLAAPSRKISMKRPSLAVSGPNPSELWKRYWKKVVDIIFWGCTFSAQLIYWVRKFEVLPTHFPWVLTMQRSVLQVIKKQKRCASKRWSFSMRYEPLTPSFDHVKGSKVPRIHPP